MEQKKQLIAGKCPHCMTELHIEEGESIYCPSCDSLVTAAEITGNSFSSNADGNTAAAAEESKPSAQYAVFIETPDSALAYLNNRFDAFDWEEYETSNVFDIDGISAVVEKNKVTNADNPQTWSLEFESIIVPMYHKLVGLKNIATLVADVYNPNDFTNAFDKFDDYKKLACAIISRRDNVLKTLALDIDFMKKYNGEKAVISDADKRLKELTKCINTVEVVKSIEELPVVEDRINEIQKQIVDELSGLGIDAEQVYNEAVDEYTSPDKSLKKALMLFYSLKGYRDSSEYIRKINSFSFFNGVIDISNTTLYAITEKNTRTFDVNDQSEKESDDSTNADQFFDGNVTNLYKVENKKVDSEHPIAEGISYFLASHGGMLYYIQEEMGINALDIRTNNIIELDEGDLYCYARESGKADGGRVIWAPDSRSIYLKKVLDVSELKRGCFARKKNAPLEMNNYELLKIDLDYATVSTVVEKIVDVMDVYGDYVFFTTSRTVEKPVDESANRRRKKKTPPPEWKTYFSSYNMKTGEIKDILDEHCCIIGTKDNKIVYSRYSPITYNMDLFVYDTETDTSLLLENNIYSAWKNVHNDKVLYTVGSAERRSMFSLNLDGSDRHEILLNVEEIFAFDANWMYVVKGSHYNTRLIKISYDGKKKVIIATGIDRIIEKTSGFIYYVANNGELRVVRTDGKDNTVILRDCEDAKIVINNDDVLLLNGEYLNPEKTIVTHSLYQTDAQGHNLRKLFYNLGDMAEIDKNTVFLLKEEQRKFKITTPTNKKDTAVSTVKTNVKTFYTYDKQTGAIDTLLEIGIPSEKEFEFKAGCFGKKKIKKNSTVEEIRDEGGYSRKGKMKPGEIAESNA